MKQYKLKKDLPTFKVGDLFRLASNGCLVQVGGDRVIVYDSLTLEKFPNILDEWFDEVEVEYARYRQAAWDKYFSIDDEGRLMTCTDLGRADDDYRFNIGNYFPADPYGMKQAEKYLQKRIDEQTLIDSANGYEHEVGYTYTMVIYDRFSGKLETRSMTGQTINNSVKFDPDTNDAEQSIKNHKDAWLRYLGVAE